jgi:hypothetical protein
MNDLIERIVKAIIRQEAMPADFANPGNLRAAPWLKAPMIGGGFWKPATRAMGVAGAAHVVSLHIAEGNSLTQLISIWAPASDNNDTKTYILNVQEWAAIPDVNQPLWDYILPE